MFAKELEKYGLSKGEANVYSALLQFGDASASELAKSTSLGRTNIYEYANSLIKKGLVSEFEKNNKIFYRADDPDQLKDVVNKQVREAKELALSLTEVLPRLEEMFNANSSKPAIKFFSGKNGFRDFFDKMYLNSDVEDYYLIVKDIDNYSPPQPKHRNALMRRQAFTHLFTNKGEMLKEFQNRDQRELRKTIELSPSQLNIGTDIILYSDQIAFGNISDDNFNVTVIKSEDLAELLRALLKNLT